nr:hypothetical protein PJ912_00255 [Pectobacterium colocasium]
MKPLLLAAALFSPLAMSATFHLASKTATMTIEMSNQSKSPIKFGIMGNGPAINGMPGVCEISGEAPILGRNRLRFSVDVSVTRQKDHGTD